MNRISAPAGLPHSCADMVRPSGVFTVIGLYFKSCPKLGCAIARNKAAAAVSLMRRPSQTEFVIATLPLFFCWGQASTCAKGVKVGQRRVPIGWRNGPVTPSVRADNVRANLDIKNPCRGSFLRRQIPVTIGHAN